MDHAGRHVIEAAWPKLHSVPLTCECGVATDHCVGLVYRMPGPLAKICTFLSFESVEELGSKPDLQHMNESIVQEYEEVME